MLLELVQFVATVSSFGMYLAPWPSMKQNIADRSTKNQSSIPLFSIFASSLLWTGYGMVIRDSLIVFSNLLGVVLGAIYSVSFYNMTVDKVSLTLTAYKAQLSVVELYHSNVHLRPRWSL
jgi:hypothetical protein